MQQFKVGKKMCDFFLQSFKLYTKCICVVGDNKFFVAKQNMMRFIMAKAFRALCHGII